MNSARPPGDDAPSPTRIVEINRICDRFEAAWRAGRRPAAEDHLGEAAGPARSGLLAELLATELECRRAAGERPDPAEYRARFPDHAAVVEAAFARVGIAPAPAAADTGRNLLLGLLALQNDFIDRDALLAAFATWVADKARPLGGILLERGAIDGPRHALLEALVGEHLKRHGGDPERSLAALSSIGSARRDLEQLDDPDIQASLAATASRAAEGDGDPEATARFTGSSPSARRAGDRFRILRFHRQGGLGRVYVARDEELGREVALKEIRPDMGDRTDLRGRFVLEAEINGGLEHPGIIPVYSLGTYDDGRPFYAMRFVEGDSLKEAIAAYHAAHPRPDPAAVEFRKLLGRIVDVCEAIAFAHSRGVLHRDLKPHNVMLGRYGETLLIDWGLAKATGRREASVPAAAVEATLVPPSGSGQAATVGVLGSPPYMSPEQAAGETESLGPATDVYGLGAILFALLTGEPPVEGRTTEEILDRVRRGAIESPRSLNPRIPRALEAVCLKALAPKPEGRYPSARALADDLERWLADEPVRAYSEPGIVRARRWMRRHRTLVTTAAAVLVFSMAGLAGFATVLAGKNRELDAKNVQVVQERDRFRAARDRAEANHYRSLVGEARAQMQARDTGWWWKAMDNLREASRLDVAARDPVELRELVIQCLGSQYPCLRLAGEWAGHEGPVSSVAVSPDGRFAVSGSGDRTVRLWRMPGGQPLAVLSGHTQAVTGVSFHRDGRHVASGSLDGSVRVWDIAPWRGAEESEPEHSGEGIAPAGGTVRPARVLDLGAGAVLAVAYSADGAWLGAACGDGTLRLLAADLRSLTPQPAGPPPSPRVLSGHSRAVRCLAFSPKGKVLASGSDDGTIRFWDLVAGELTASWAAGFVLFALTFSPDGNSLSWTTSESYDFTTRHLKAKDKIYRGFHAEAVLQVVHGKSHLLTASADGTLKLWARPSGRRDYQESAVAEGEFGAVRSVAMDHDERRLVAGYQDGRVRLWELADFAHRALVSGEQNAVFVGDRRRLVSGSDFHDFSAGINASTESYRPAATRALTVHPDGRSFAFGRDNGALHIWDLEHRREVLQWSAHGQGVSTLVASPDGKYLASASSEGAVKLWHWDSSHLERELDPGVGPIHQVAWSRDARRLAATGERGTIVWDVVGQTGPRRLGEHPREARALAFGTSSLALSGANGDVEIWDLQSWRKLRTLRGHRASVHVLEFSPDGNRLASAAGDESIRLWDPSSGQEEAVLKCDDSRLLSHCSWLSFQPHGSYLVSGGPDSSTIIWDLNSKAAVAFIEHESCPCGGKFVQSDSAFLLGGSSSSVSLCAVAEIDHARARAQGPNERVPLSGMVRVFSTATIVAGGHVQVVWGVAASPDGRWVATASHDGSVKLWDARDMQLMRTFAGHGGLAWCVAFSPDGKYLASGGVGLKVWEVATGRELHHFDEHKRMISSVAFHPNGQWLASGSYDGTVRLWDVAEGRSLGVLHQFDLVVNNLAFRPDGRWLACAGHDQQIHLWDFGRGPPTLPAPPDRTLTGHSAIVWSVGWSADGRYLASGSERGVIILWNGDTFSRVVTLRGGTGQIRGISFSRDGCLLAGAAYFASTIVWDLPRLRQTLAELNVASE
jgi:WD40 repeat protein/tRNA A-37 threonylcarbamoyl transferase component Bud32